MDLAYSSRIAAAIFFRNIGKKAAPASFNHTEGEIGRRIGNRFISYDVSRVILFHEGKEIEKYIVNGDF